jgi:hypothetical protein
VRRSVGQNSEYMLKTNDMDKDILRGQAVSYHLGPLRIVSDNSRDQLFGMPSEA